MARSATIGTLGISIAARTKGLKKGLRSAGRDVNKFGKSLARIGFGAARLGSLFTGVTAGGLGVFVKSSIDAIDAQRKFAARIGASAQGLAALELQNKRAGNSTETLRMGLQRMTRRVAEAAKGSGEAVGALKELGLEATSLNRLSPDRQFGLIADAFEKIRDPADRVRLAMKLFDSEGVALVNTMLGGSSALSQAFTDAEKFGLIIDDVAGTQLEDLTTNLGDIGSMFEGMGKQLAVAISPALGNVVDKTKEWIESNGGVSGLVDTILPKVIDKVGMIGDAFNLAKAGVDAFAGAVQLGFGSLLEAIPQIGGAIQKAFGKFIEFGDDIASKLFSGAGKGFTKIADVLDKIRPAGQSKQLFRRAGDFLSGAGADRESPTAKFFKESGRRMQQQGSAAGRFFLQQGINNLRSAEGLVEGTRDVGAAARLRSLFQRPGATATEPTMATPLDVRGGLDFQQQRLDSINRAVMIVTDRQQKAEQMLARAVSALEGIRMNTGQQAATFS